MYFKLNSNIKIRKRLANNEAANSVDIEISRPSLLQIDLNSCYKTKNKKINNKNYYN